MPVISLVQNRILPAGSNYNLILKGLEMPGHIVQINNSKDQKWYVGDSKIDSLLKWLAENGVKKDSSEKPTVEGKIESDL